MTNVDLKLRRILLPFLIISFSFVVIYTFLHWLLFVRLELFSIDEKYLMFWMPFVLPWIPILIWLRPRMKMLVFKNENGNFGYTFLATLAIAFSTIMAQEFMITQTGELTQLQRPSSFVHESKTKYYKFTQVYVDEKRIGVTDYVAASGKNNRDLRFSFYVVMPVLDRAQDTIAGKASLFLAKKYSKTISNSLSAPEKERMYEEFAADVEREFNGSDFQTFTYLETLGNTEDFEHYQEAVKKSKVFVDQEPVILIARQNSFDERSGDSLLWIFLSFLIGTAVIFLLLLFPKIDLKKGPGRKRDVDMSAEIRDALFLFIPRKDFFVTPILIDINIAVYLMMVFSGLGMVAFSGQDLLHWGANHGPATKGGEWWRLFTSMFLHGGIMHLLANIIGLLFVGVILEPIVGRIKFLVSYFLSGLAGSIASLWWHDAVVSVGASGAIFGLYGTFTALLLNKAFPSVVSKPFLISTLIFIGYNLLIGLTGGIDNAAHIGGLLAGFFIGWIFSFSVRKARQEYNKSI